jgi:hypothetical protein
MATSRPDPSNRSPSPKGTRTVRIATRTRIAFTAAEIRMLHAALHDHVLALESNARRAGRGHTIAVDQEDMESAALFESARAKVVSRIASVRALRKRVH